MNMGRYFILFLCCFFFGTVPFFVARPCGDMKRDEPPEGQLKIKVDTSVGSFHMAASTIT